MMTEYYKVLGPDGAACNGGSGQWPLANGRPGAWLDVTGDLVPCQNGLHVCTRAQLIDWLGPTIWRVEVDPAEVLAETDKTVVRRARLLSQLETWTERTARLFAADCAERALERERREGREPDARSWAAITAARACARGEIDAAARAAARDAAWDAASAAERRWQTERLWAYLDGTVSA